MILVIKTNKEELHDLEFVRPIESILKNSGKKFFSRHYREVQEIDLKNAEKVIICGTSLRDNFFLEDLSFFSWIKDFEKPLLGICAGMQIIGLLSGGFLKKKKEIGFYSENFKNSFLGLRGDQEVYHLHNSYVGLWNDFEKFTENKTIVQAVKHKKKEIYGVLFHPEVRQKNIIEEFSRI